MKVRGEVWKRGMAGGREGWREHKIEGGKEGKVETREKGLRKTESRVCRRQRAGSERERAREREGGEGA